MTLFLVEVGCIPTGFEVGHTVADPSISATARPGFPSASSMYSSGVFRQVRVPCGRHKEGESKETTGENEKIPKTGRESGAEKPDRCRSSIFSQTRDRAGNGAHDAVG